MGYIEKRDLILKYIKLYKIDDDIQITEEMLENMITYMDYILEKNNGTAKKFELLSPFYAPKNSTSDYDLFAPEDFEVIDDYQFADERDK